MAAGHIAAITVFAQRYAIWIDRDDGQIPDEDVTIPMLIAGDTHAVAAMGVPALREALATGLFSARGDRRLGWAHQSYATFLAAQYLVQQELSLPQLTALITSPYDGQIVPQLREAAAWLANLHPEMFRTILDIDPKVLLQSDVATATDRDRTALVGRLLTLFDAQQLRDHDRDLRYRYRKLAHPGLANQLRPYIEGVTKGWLVRRVAIDIAEACELRELQNDLVTIALDGTQLHPTRVEAAHAVFRIGDETTKVQLRPLVFGEAGDDPDDELKGHGLFAMWPTSLRAEDLFRSLSIPKQANRLGTYKYFLLGDFTYHLQPEDLPSALRWVDDLPHLHAYHAVRQAAECILLKAWDHVEQPGVIDLFARITLKHLRHDHTLLYENSILQRDQEQPDFRAMLREQHDKRRSLISAILPHMTTPSRDALALIYAQTPIVTAPDFGWLIEQYQRVEAEDLRAKLTELIAYTFNWQDPTHLAIVYDAYDQQRPLPPRVIAYIEPVELNTPVAQELRESYYRKLELEARQAGQQQQPPINPPPAVRIQERLADYEAGDMAAWWRLNMWMQYEPDGTSSIAEYHLDLTQFPGWMAADENTQQRMIDAARHYGLHQHPQPDRSIHTNTLFRPDIAGYRALRLLFQVTPASVNELPVETWQRWMPIIVGNPFLIGSDQEQVDNRLLQIAYQSAPEDGIRHILQQLAYEDSETPSLTIMRRIEYCWDARIAVALLHLCQEHMLSTNGMATVLEQLLIHRVDGAKAWAEQLVTVPVPQEDAARERAVAAARMLMIHTDDAGWAAIWPAFQQDVVFGREVITAIVTHAYGLAERVELTAEQLADLYLWLVQQYPFTKDPEEDGNMGVLGLITWERDGLLQRMQSMGTQESVTALQRIVEVFPEEDRFNWALLNAREHARQHLWIAPRPATILQLIADRQRRLVQNGNQLLEVICESLERLEHKLHGETPAIVDLWNITGIRANRAYTPKDENMLSDYIKRHLEDDLRGRGVIANREVEIRRSEHHATGERTDIHVQAFVETPPNNVYDTITVIIEVKGCWHRDLAQAMETQLVNRYLRDNQCRHGLYLIGWFNCDQWSTQDRRKQAAPQLAITDAKAQYEQQAANLSNERVTVQAYVLNTAVRPQGDTGQR